MIIATWKCPECGDVWLCEYPDTAAGQVAIMLCAMCQHQELAEVPVA